MKKRKNVKWMRNSRRILSVLLALAMVLGPVELSLPAYAESPDSAPAEEVLSDTLAEDSAADAPDAELATDAPDSEPALDATAEGSSTDAPAADASSDDSVAEPTPDAPDTEASFDDPAADVPSDVPTEEPAPDGSAADVPSDVPTEEPSPDGSAADVPSDVPTEEPATDGSAADAPSDVPAEEPAPDGPDADAPADAPDAEPAPGDSDEYILSDGSEPSASPELSPDAVEKTVFTVVHHYPDDGDEAYLMTEAPEVPEDTDIAADAASEEELTTPEEEPAAYPATGEILPDGTVYLYETEGVYEAPYVVLPEPQTDDDGNVLAPFSGFTVEEGEAAVTIKGDDPATACAEINYEPGTPRVVLHVYYDDFGIAPISIGVDVANADKVKDYFVNNGLTGTYVTKKDLEDRSDVEWSIVIADDGDISLLYKGADTGAKVTNFNDVNNSTGKPGAIVFSHTDWYTDETGDTKQILTVTLDSSNGYFTMPDNYQIYWDQDNDGEREAFSFSKAPFYYNETILKNFFDDFPGEYTLPDGSGWKVTVGADGDLTLSGGNGTEKAFVNYIDIKASTVSADHRAVSSVIFTSPDWYKNDSKKTNFQTLTLTWTTQVNSKAHKSFKVKTAITFYDADKNPIKGFKTNCYFIADNGIFSYGYFLDPGQNDKGQKKEYIGTYALSDAYKTVYSGDIEDIDSWYIEINGTGHVYLHAGEEMREAVMTSGSSGPDRVSKMVVCVPGWYEDTVCATPALIDLTWNFDTTAKTAKLYFTSDTFQVYKPDEDGNTGNKAVKGHIPAMRFELSKGTDSEITAYAKEKLSAVGEDEEKTPLYVGKYFANDDSGEYIEIKKDGSTVLCIPKEDEVGSDAEYDEYTPLYYELKDAKWLTDGGDSAVTAVVFSAPDWFGAPNQTFADADRQTVTMTWNATNLQFTAEEKTCYKENSDTVVRAYTVNTKYNLAAINAEAAAYFSQYVHGTYTLNDGSGWKIKVAEDEKKGWTIYTDFDGDGEEDYEAVGNPAPVFTYDKNHTSASTSTTNGEWGNDGRYLDNITVPVPGWFTDEDCTRNAIVTLTWKGGVTNPMDDHQFNVGLDKTTGYALYRKGADGTVECKYMAGTFYSDHDRELGEYFLKSLGVAGTYQPTAAEGKWWIVIDGEGKVTVHATDSKGEEHTITDVAMDLTIDKSKKNDANLHFGDVKGVTDIKVVIPEWRTAGTNDTLANIAQCAEITFTFVLADNGSSYFTPSNTYIYADAKEGGSPWEVVTKTSAPGYNKTFITKIYDNDRAYSDANKDAAKEYFKKYPGTYYIEDPKFDYQITVTEEGQIYWGDLTSLEKPLPADVAFDAIRDDNENGKVDAGETTPVPGTISVWLNGYCTGNYNKNTKDPFYTDGTQRADFTWNDMNEAGTTDTKHKFKSSGKSAAKGYVPGTREYVSFAVGLPYVPREEEVTFFAADGTYETTDGAYKIVIETDEDTGKTSYTFYRPDLPDPKCPLNLFGTADAPYLRGKIGMYKKNDVYLVVTKISSEGYENFLFTAYEVTYNDLGGKQQNSSSAPTVTLPAMTRFTDYSKVTTGEGPFVVAEPGEDAESGTPYSRLSLALHNIKGGDTLYLKDDVEIDFAAKLPDDVGKITIDGQGHTIKRGTHVIPSLAKNISADPILMDILTDPDMDPGILLMALEDEGEALSAEHYTGAILQVGAGDEVTLKDVTIDGEGKWEIDQDKLEYDKQLNQDYDINVLDDPNGGHPIKELEGNVVSTDSLIKVAGGTLILDGVTLENFFAGDGYDDDRHFIDFMSTEDGKLDIKSDTVFQHNASRSGVCIGNTDKDEILLNGCTTMKDNYCYGGNGGLVVAMEGTQIYMNDGTQIINNVAADTNGVFIQLHKKTDGVKDGDNKGEIYSKLQMDGGYIHNNIGLRGGSYGWGQTVYLYNGGSFEMNGGDICCNMGAGISSIYQQPSADGLKLNAGHIHNNTCSLVDGDIPLDIALMNIGDLGEKMIVEQNFVVGAAAILGGYASGDEYLTNDGVIKGSISVYSYFNNEGNVTTVVNNNTIDGDIRLENGSMVKNGETGKITGNVTIRGSLTESAGESSLHNEGRIDGNVELAENTHFYNSGEVYGNVTVKSGGTLELNCNDKDHEPHGGTIHGNVTVYPDGLIYAEVTPTEVDGIITFEYEDEEERERMQEVLEDSGISCTEVIYKKHKHTVSVADTGAVQGEWDETTIEPDDDYKCTDPWTKLYACQTCGKVVVTKETESTGQHEFYVDSTTEATCTTGKIEKIRCRNCSAYNSSTKELKIQVSDPLGHDYKELEELYIPPTTYGSGHLYYVCTRCGKLLEFEIDEVSVGKHKHTFQNEDGSLNDKADGVKIEPASCEEPGKITFECQDGCGTKIEFEIPKTGHKYPPCSQ